MFDTDYDPQPYDADDLAVEDAMRQAWLLTAQSDLDLALDAAGY